MHGFKKYLIIIAGAIIGLWLTSIMIYWNEIGSSFLQIASVLIDSMMEIIITIIGIGILLSVVIFSGRR